MIHNYFFKNDGKVEAFVYDHINKSRMTLKRLENFEELNSNLYFLI